MAIQTMRTPRYRWIHMNKNRRGPRKVETTLLEVVVWVQKIFPIF